MHGRFHFIQFYVQKQFFKTTYLLIRNSAIQSRKEKSKDKREGGVRKRERYRFSIPWFTLQLWNCQGWTRSKPRAQNSIGVRDVTGRSLAPKPLFAVFRGTVHQQETGMESEYLESQLAQLGAAHPRWWLTLLPEDHHRPPCPISVSISKHLCTVNVLRRRWITELMTKSFSGFPHQSGT